MDFVLYSTSFSLHSVSSFSFQLVESGYFCLVPREKPRVNSLLPWPGLRGGKITYLSN